MDLQKIIAANTKAIREQKKLTLDAAAKQTGVSRSMLAQIEKGDVNPTISVLWKIANGYKVSFTTLMEDQAQTAFVLRAEEIVPLDEDGGRYRLYPIFPFNERQLFETYRVEIQPEGHLEAQPHMPGTEEYITVFSGTAAITVGKEVFRLSAGDSIRFKADTEHSYQNIGSETVWLNMLIYYGEKNS